MNRMNTNTSSAIVRPLFDHHNERTQAQRQQDVALVVQRAAQGDRAAIDVVARRCRRMLLDVARLTLGGRFRREAEDVVQDFFVVLLEGKLRFDPEPSRAVPWMCDIVRAMAQKNRQERLRDWGLDDQQEEGRR
jgi:DNA-directed RNA polymerase specialized sigma24 family protein